MPDELTLVMAGVLVDQLTVRPASDRVCPDPFLAITPSWSGWPGDRVAVEGDTVTENTGSGATVTVAVPVAPSLVAVMVADPAVTPVTTPDAETLATCGSLLAYEMVLPVRTCPLSSVTIELSCSVCPAKIVTCPGDTMTALAGRAVTFTVVARSDGGADQGHSHGE